MAKRCEGTSWPQGMICKALRLWLVIVEQRRNTIDQVPPMSWSTGTLQQLAHEAPYRSMRFVIMVRVYVICLIIQGELLSHWVNRLGG